MTISITSMSILDLIPPHLLTQIVTYQAELNDIVDLDWERRHIYAAETLIEYARSVHPNRKLAASCDKLARKLNLDTGIEE
jgi:hypothetical protein